MWCAIVIPANEPAFTHYDNRTHTRYLLIGGAFVQPPGSIDLPIRPADGALVPKAQARGNMFVAHALRQQLCYRLLIRLQQRQRGLLILLAHLLNPRFDLWVNETAPGYSILQQRDDHLRQEIVGLAHIGVVTEDAGAAECTKVRIVVLNRIEHHRHTREL